VLQVPRSITLDWESLKARWCEFVRTGDALETHPASRMLRTSPAALRRMIYRAPYLLALIQLHVHGLLDRQPESDNTLSGR
jgi:hypothetical protein